MARTRVVKYVKAIAVSAEGNITEKSVDLPKKNVFVRTRQDSYPIENRDKYREFSKTIAEKVKVFKAMKAENKKLQDLVRKNSMRTIDETFKKIMIKADE